MLVNIIDSDINMIIMHNKLEVQEIFNTKCSNHWIIQINLHLFSHTFN